MQGHYEYEYGVMPAEEVMQISSSLAQTRAGTAPVDSFLSEDASLQTYRNLLKSGFRWIRTDGDQAIFERSHFVYQPVENRP
jgi:hypothetical protein